MSTTPSLDFHAHLVGGLSTELTGTTGGGVFVGYEVTDGTGVGDIMGELVGKGVGVITDGPVEGEGVVNSEGLFPDACMIGTGVTVGDMHTVGCGVIVTAIFSAY